MAYQPYAGTQTASQTASWTDARVKAVMSRVLDDMNLLVARGFLSREKALKWYDDVSFVLRNECLERMELQLSPPGRAPLAIRYEVVHAGLYANDPSGGLNLYGFPEGTTATILIQYRSLSPAYNDVVTVMNGRGWGPGGQFVDGAARDSNSYSKDGLGVRRQLVGWE